MMEYSRQDIFYIPIEDDYLIYSPLQGVAALINSEAFNILNTNGLQGGNWGVNNPLSELCQIFLIPAQKPPAERSGPFNPEFLGLIPTRGCNMECAYCDFRPGEGQMMVMETQIAFRALEWIAEKEVEAGRRLLNVHFFGGEPFLPMDLVKQVVRRARILAEERGLRPRFEACTNGTFSEQDALWIADNFDTVILSLDGPAEIQNQYRPMKGGRKSFPIVHRNARIFGQGTGEFCIRICVHNKNIEGLEETVQWFLKEYNPSMIAIEPIKITPDVTAGLKPPNPTEFVRQFAGAAMVMEAHGVRAVHSMSDTEQVQSSFCPVGKDGFIISPDGRISACYLLERDWCKKGLDLNFGDITQEGRVVIRGEDLKRIRKLIVQNKERCKTCFCKWHCAGGCHVSHTPPGYSNEYSDLCQQTRAITVWKLLRGLNLEDRAEEFLKDPVVRGDGINIYGYTNPT